MRSDFGDFGLAKLGHGPIAFEAANLAHKVTEQLCSIGRMDDLGVELRAVKFAFLIGNHRKRRAVAGGDNLKTGRKLRHRIAMAHPDLMAFALGPKPIEQSARLGDGKVGSAKFAAIADLMTRPYFAAQLLAHHLLAIANAEDWHASFKQHIWGARTVSFGHAGGRAGQDDASRLHPLESLFGHSEGRNLGIDPRLAHAPRDQLGHLAAEIDDQDGIGRGCIAHDDTHCRAGSAESSARAQLCAGSNDRRAIFQPRQPYASAFETKVF